MIRKSGWLVFIALVSAILLLVYVVAGPAIRAGMIYTLEKAVGAEVNIARVSLGLAPLSLKINNLQITDKEQPTHNLVSIGHIHAGLEFWPALLGYTVINDLSVDGLAYGTERRSPGKVFEREPEEAQEKVDLMEVLQLDIPDADELLARANLQTRAKGEALKTQAETQQQALEDLESRLPDKQRLAKIQADIKTLTESRIENAADLATKTEQLKRLQDDLKGERDKLRQVRQELTQSRDTLQQSVAALRQASADDWQQLQQLANISEGGLAPISQILLGDVWGERIGQLESLYRLVAPYISENLSFGGASEEAEPKPIIPNRILPLPRQPYPGFLVRNARVNWLVAGGEATISLQDITAQHAIINAPTRFNLNVQNLPRLTALDAQGDFRIMEQMVTNLRWQMVDFIPEEITIGRDSTALELIDGRLNLTGNLQLVNNRIEQSAELVLAQPAFKTEGSTYLQQLAELLNKQQRIPLTLAAQGLLSNPDISVRSPLDSLIGDALLGEAREKVAELETDLRQRLDRELQEQLGGQGDWAALLDRQDGEVQSMENNIESMLEARLDGLKDSATDQLRNRLLNR